MSDTTTIRFPREALADALERIAAHARKYEINDLSMAYDGTMYRISFSGEGELVPEGDGS